MTRKGKCVYCHNETEVTSKVFQTWICDESCENKLIDAYLDEYQALIKNYEASLDEDASKA